MALTSLLHQRRNIIIIFTFVFVLGSNKTVEGTIGCAVGQMAALVVLAGLGHVPVTLNMNLFKVVKPLLVVCFTSLVEAKTDQIDNLVLPLLTYILLLL